MRKITPILLLIFGLLLAGCQANDQQSAATAVPESTAITEAVAPTEAPATEPAAEAAAPSMQPRYEPLPPGECFATPPEDVEIAVEYDCGYVVVPEFYNGESKRTVKVPFMRFNSPQGATASPVVLHPGGPGQSHINELGFREFNVMFDGVIPDRDVIFMDPRGTEHADTFLDCPASFSLSWQAYEQGLDEEELTTLFADTMQQCIDDFKAQGVNLDAYNSLELAGDVNSVRQALGYEQIIYLGTSYGSQLGQHIMRDYPEILEAVILNGSAPLSRLSWVEDRALDNQVAFDNLVALCESDEKCNTAYPDIPGLLDATLAHFQDGPLPYTYTDPNDPSLIIEGEVDASDLAGFIHSLQGDKNTIFSLPSLLASWASPDQTEAVAAFLSETSAQSIIASRDLTKGAEAFLMHLAVVCSDDPVKSADEIIRDGVGDYALLTAQGMAKLYENGCPLVNVQELPDGTDDLVTTDVPTLLLSGSLDVATPPIRSQLIADALPNATHVIFPGHTHDQIGGLSACTKNVLTQFIADPAGALDTSCLETPDYIGFLLPDGSYSLSYDEEGNVPETGDEQAEAGAESALPEDLTAQLDTYLQSQVYTEGGDPVGAAPGLVLYVKTPDGTYLNAAGVSSLEDGTPMQPDDILEIGSNTKSMTIVLLMQLVEQGLISLDDPLSQWLPEQAAALPNGDQITIRQMAQHTAGLWDYGEGLIGAGAVDPDALVAGFTPEEMVQFAVDNGTPYFAPSEEGQFHYSNTGYIMLGMIIEQITGQKIGDLMQTRIFDPLGMESAVFLEGVPQPGQITTQGYWWTEDGERVNTTNWNATQGWAAGAAAMTASDLATYGQGLAAGELFQNADTLNEMLTFYPPAQFSLLGSYGLGLLDFAGDGTMWGHGGQTLGFQSLWYVNPEKDIVVVGLTNSATYSSNAFMNVNQILKGDGALPFVSSTLMPAGRFVPSNWTWVRFDGPDGATDVDKADGLIMSLAKDQSVLGISAECGNTGGTFTVDQSQGIDLDIDASTLTCDGESTAGQFVQYLNDAVSWRFDNGRLILDLPEEGGSMVFEVTKAE